MVDDLEYDPEKGLWRPGRRTFLFMFGAAAVGAVLKPVMPHFVEATAAELEAEGMAITTTDFAKLLVETFSRDRVFAPFERKISPFHDLSNIEVMLGTPEL